MIKYIYFEKKPFKIFLSRYFINNGTPSCDVCISAGRVHHLNNGNRLDAKDYEKQIIDINLTKLNVRPNATKILAKIKHTFANYYKDFTPQQKEEFRVGVINRRSGINDYVTLIQPVILEECIIEVADSIPEPNGSETCIEIGEIKFNDGFVEINQKLKSDIFLGPIFIGTAYSSSEESSEESISDSSDSSYEPSYDSSDQSSEEPSDPSVPSEPPYVPPSDESSDISVEPPPESIPEIPSEESI